MPNDWPAFDIDGRRRNNCDSALELGRDSLGTLNETLSQQNGRNNHQGQEKEREKYGRYDSPAT
jgi:hypothetical protein